MKRALRTVGYELRTRLLGRPTVAPIGGHSRIIICPGETKGSHARRNLPNWPEMGVWRQHPGPSDLFIDVRATIGTYTLFAVDFGAEVIACGPDRHTAQRLQENLVLNGVTAEVVQKTVSGARESCGSRGGSTAMTNWFLTAHRRTTSQA